MELLKYELRKIWNPLLVLMIVILGGLYYFLFSSYYIEYFKIDGDPLGAGFELAAGWAEKYGPTMEPSERAELDAQSDAERAIFAETVSAWDWAAARGIVDWDSFSAFEQGYYAGAEREGAQADMEMESVIWRIVYNSNYHTITSLENVIRAYDGLKNDVPPNLNYDGVGDSAGMGGKKLARVGEIKSSGMVHGYLPASVLESTRSYGTRLAVWCVLSVILLLSPTLVRDRLWRTGSMQWASRRGRRIWNTQLLAALLSAAVLALMDITAYALPLLAQGALVFKDFRLFLFLSFAHPWVDWTYGQYLLAAAAMSFLLTVAAGGLTVMLSQYSGHYVAMLLKALPLFAAMACVCYGIMDRAFFFGNPLSEGLELPGAELLGAAALLLLTAALLWLARCRQARREL